MRARDRLRFLFGPNLPPPLRRGDRTYWHVRCCEVIITGWNVGRNPWPRCRDLGNRGGLGLLVDESLAFAGWHKFVVAITYWFGVGMHTPWNWLKALAVKRMANPGSRGLQPDVGAVAV